GSLLSLASLNISSLTTAYPQDSSEERRLGKVREILSNVTVIVRDLSHRLTPMAIEKYGFKKAVEELAETINLSGKLSLETVLIGFENTHKYEVSILNHLYRIIQELLNNTIKHANATHAILELIEHQKGISLIIEDNGSGIPEHITGNGQGLHSIQSKIAYLKGTFEINKKRDGGTLVVVELPT
ncbi:MAG: hypothetical protein KGM98_14755, partial [Bacteroidota bacterium]|nr:hypothetical protein [Bacteroidota bacterium]